MKMKKNKIVVGVICALLLTIGCKSKDKEPTIASKEDDTIFYDYKIIAEEGNDNLLVMAQVKHGGEEADGKPLAEGTSILLDGQAMEKDSAKIGGIYYEKYFSVESFAGQHQFVINKGGKKVSEASFAFQPFVLATVLDKTVSRKAFQLQFGGLDSSNDLRIVLTDTSFESEGVNELWQAKDSVLAIGTAMLANLKNGPVQLSLTREKEQALKKDSRLLTLYTIRREFLLTD